MKEPKTSAFYTVLHREIERISRNRALMFVSMIGPALSIFLIVWLFSANVPRDLPIGIIDLDKTQTSRKLISMVDASSIAEVYKNYNSLSEAKAAIEKGEIEAAIYIPYDAERSIMKGSSTTVAIYLNNMNVVKGGLLNSGIRKSIATLSAGIKLQMQLKNGYRQEQAMGRIMPISLHSVLLFNPYTSYSYYLTLNLLFVSLMVFVLLGTIYAVGNELYQGTGIEWIKLAGKDYITALVGKLLPYTTIFFIYSIILDWILFYIIGVPMHGKIGMLIIGQFFLICSYHAMAIFLLSITTNMRLSLSLGSGYIMLAITFCGLTFPILAMPVIAQTFASIFPFTYWVKILMGQSLRGEPLVNSILPMYYLIVFIIFGFLFLPRLMRMMFTRKRWGKK